MLSLIQQANRPAYVEVDENDAVTRVEIPKVAKVVRITPIPSGGFDVTVDASVRALSLRPSAPRYEEFLSVVRDAFERDLLVVVTEECDGEELLDVRLWPGAPPPVVSPTQPILFGKPALESLLTTEPAEARKGVQPDSQRGNVRRRGAVLGCIPFKFPKNGCWARAHRMCEIMLDEFTIRAGKVWIFGKLKADTLNDPTCLVEWDFHVAPLLSVQYGKRTRLMVIDPARSDHGPVTLRRWKRRVHGISKTMVTGASVFRQLEPGRLELEGENETNKTLLLLLADFLCQVFHHGTPPYTCPPTMAR